MRMNDCERQWRSACFVSLSFAGLVVLARSLNPIPSRTRPLNSSAPMVLWLKPWESRSLPGLPRTKQFLFTCHDQTKRRFPQCKFCAKGRRRFCLARPRVLLVRPACGSVRLARAGSAHFTRTWRLARSVTVHRSSTMMPINVIGTVMQGTRPTGKIASPIFFRHDSPTHSRALEPVWGRNRPNQQQSEPIKEPSHA